MAIANNVFTSTPRRFVVRLDFGITGAFTDMEKLRDQLHFHNRRLTTSMRLMYRPRTFAGDLA